MLRVFFNTQKRIILGHYFFPPLYHRWGLPAMLYIANAGGRKTSLRGENKKRDSIANVSAIKSPSVNVVMLCHQ
jgi:hypothetical protein